MALTQSGAYKALPVAPVSAAPPRKSRMRGRVKPLPNLQGSGAGSDAGLPPAPGGSFEETVDRRRLSEDILCEGYVQSFVDFFYLTHRPEPNVDTANADGQAQEIQVPPKEMLYVRDNLTAAENARRQGDTGTVYGSYSNLAQHYHVSLHSTANGFHVEASSVPPPDSFFFFF